MFQESIELLLDSAESRIFRVAGASEFNIHDFGNVPPGRRGHESYAVCQHECFVQVMGDHQYGGSRIVPDTQQVTLHHPAGLHVQCGEGFIQQ